MSRPLARVFRGRRASSLLPVVSKERSRALLLARKAISARVLVAHSARPLDLTAGGVVRMPGRIA